MNMDLTSIACPRGFATVHRVKNPEVQVIGDPACDLSIAWTLFEKESRECFFAMMRHDETTWERARAWTLWKALLVAAEITNPDNFEAKRCWKILEAIL